MNWYKFLPYDKNYPLYFEEEKIRLQKVLGKHILIEHFGSTAVPGLGGKGVIDIYVAVPKDDMQNISDKLQKKLGYTYKSNAGIKNERLFHDKTITKKSGAIIHYHIHVTYLNNKNLKECIAFRDYLRTHPIDAKTYAEIKKSAVEKVGKLSDKELAKKKYLEMKGEFIKDILRNAVRS